MTLTGAGLACDMALTCQEAKAAVTAVLEQFERAESGIARLLEGSLTMAAADAVALSSPPFTPSAGISVLFAVCWMEGMGLASAADVSGAEALASLKGEAAFESWSVLPGVAAMFAAAPRASAVAVTQVADVATGMWAAVAIGPATVF